MKDIAYIELIGIPGTGKTTAAKLLVAILQEAGTVCTYRAPLRVNVFRKFKIILAVCWLVLKTPALLRLWTRAVVPTYRSLPHVRLVIRTIRRRLLLESSIVRHLLAPGDSVVVNDEGVIGKLVVLSLLTGIDEEMVFELLTALLPNNACIICITTPTERAIARALERDIVIPFFHDMDVEERKEFYAQNVRSYDRVCTYLNTVEGVPTVRIANTGELRELQEAINRFATTFWQSKR